MKYCCYQEYFVIHGWFVYWVFDLEMRRLSKFRFRKASFSKMSLLTSPFLMRKRVEKSQALLLFVETFLTDKLLVLKKKKIKILVLFSILLSPSSLL